MQRSGVDVPAQVVESGPIKPASPVMVREAHARGSGLAFRIHSARGRRDVCASAKREWSSRAASAARLLRRQRAMKTFGRVGRVACNWSVRASRRVQRARCSERAAVRAHPN